MSTRMTAGWWMVSWRGEADAWRCAVGVSAAGCQHAQPRQHACWTARLPCPLDLGLGMRGSAPGRHATLPKLLRHRPPLRAAESELGSEAVTHDDHCKHCGGDQGGRCLPCLSHISHLGWQSWWLPQLPLLPLRSRSACMSEGKLCPCTQHKGRIAGRRCMPMALAA